MFREVIVLRGWEGLSYKQIATLVKIPEGTVMSRLARARNSLQQRLGSQWIKESTTRLEVGAFSPLLLLHQTRKLMQLDVVQIGYCPVAHS